MAKQVSDKYQPKPYKGRGRKEELVSAFSSRVEKAQGMVFANYQGMTHHQLEELKKTVKKADGEFMITKNRLMLRALEDKNLTDEEKQQFQNPTATLFIYSDLVEPIKALAKTMKELSLPSVKFGIIEGKPVSADDIQKLSTLPALPQLRAQLVGTLNSPIQGLHRALSWNMVKLAMTLKAIEEQKAKQPAS